MRSGATLFERRNVNMEPTNQGTSSLGAADGCGKFRKRRNAQTQSLVQDRIDVAVVYFRGDLAGNSTV